MYQLLSSREANSLTTEKMGGESQSTRIPTKISVRLDVTRIDRRIGISVETVGWFLTLPDLASEPNTNQGRT